MVLSNTSSFNQSYIFPQSIHVKEVVSDCPSSQDSSTWDKGNSKKKCNTVSRESCYTTTRLYIKAAESFF